MGFKAARVAFALALFVLATQLANAQRTQVSGLASNTDITTATAGAVLVGQADGTWLKQAVPTSCPTPGGVVFNGGTFACGGGGGVSWFGTGSVVTGAGGVGYAGEHTGPTAGEVELPIPFAGTLSDMHCALSNSPAPGTLTFTLVKNGVDQGVQACTISGPCTVSATNACDCRDQTGTVAYAENDEFAVHFVGASSPASGFMRCTFKLS